MTLTAESDETMREVLQQARTIAVVGHSDDPARTSYRIARYLRMVGYTVYPVNPNIQAVDGQRSYASLADLPERVDIVNVFRRSVYLNTLVEEVIASGAPVMWTQLGVVDQNAAIRARSSGITVVMNRCIKVEHARLLEVDSH